MGVEKNGRAEDEKEKTDDHVVAVLISVLDLRLEPKSAKHYSTCL